MTPRRAVLGVLVLAGGLRAAVAADGTDADKAQRLSERLGWDLRQEQEFPATAASPLGAPPAPAPAVAALSPAGIRSARPLDAARVPALPAPSGPERTGPGSPPGISGAANAALTQVRTYACAPRPPGGIPAERLEPAARAMAQFIAHGVPPTEKTSLPPPTLAQARAEPPGALAGWTARRDGEGVLVKPALKLAPGLNVGAELSLPAVSAEPDRGVLQGNPTLTAALALGEKGKAGATRLDLGYRPEGRERTEFARVRGETTLLAQGGAAVKLKGDMALSPVAETAYTVGVTVVARVF